MCSKYQPRPQSAGSDERRFHDSPASSERKKPPWPFAPSPYGFAPADVSRGAEGSGSRSSSTAYTRFGLLGHTAMPAFPIPLFGSPFVSSFHVSPPSVLLKSPPPGPFVGAYTNQGGRRVFQSAAYTTFGFVGSITTSDAPTFSFLNSTFFHVFPPSFERKMPRSGFGP